MKGEVVIKQAQRFKDGGGFVRVPQRWEGDTVRCENLGKKKVQI